MSRTAVALVASALMFGLAIGIAYTQAPDWNKGTADEKIKRRGSPTSNPSLVHPPGPGVVHTRG